MDLPYSEQQAASYILEMCILARQARADRS